MLESPAAAITLPGFIKMPEPITDPITKDIATINPISFFNNDSVFCFKFDNSLSFSISLTIYNIYIGHIAQELLPKFYKLWQEFSGYYN